MNSTKQPRENTEGIAKFGEESNYEGAVGGETKKKDEKKSPETLEQREKRRKCAHTEKHRNIKRAGGSKGEK